MVLVAKQLTALRMFHQVEKVYLVKSALDRLGLFVRTFTSKS